MPLAFPASSLPGADDDVIVRRHDVASSKHSRNARLIAVRQGAHPR